jgi:uncharacterized membrane protein YoaK (UPF0700 family)
MSRAQVQRIHKPGRLPWWLACVGGCVDGVGYVVLSHMFTSHMSGNSVAMGVEAGFRHWSEALRRGFPIPLFVIGVAVGAALGQVLVRRGVRSTVAIVLGLEAVLLTLFMLGAHPAVLTESIPPRPDWPYYALAALPALAMGMQNAALRRYHGVTDRTTFITGNLTSLAESAIAYLFWLWDHVAPRRTRRLWVLLRLSSRRVAFVRMLLLLELWVGYVVGAIVGVALLLRWGMVALVAPVSCLIVFVIIDLLHPLSMPPSE